jgi:hypothetical protein
MDLYLVASVRLDEHRPSAECARFLGGSFCSIPIAVVDDCEVSAVARQAERQRATNAPAAAGYERALS